MSTLKPVIGWLLVVAICVVGIVLNHRDGYDQGFAAAKAQGDKALAELRQANAEATATAATKAADHLRAEVDRGNQLAASLGAKQAELRETTDRLNGEIARVTTNYRRALDAALEPLPPAVFTFGFVRLWNEANHSAASTAGLPAAAIGSSGTAPAPSGTGPFDQLATGLSQSDVLSNHIRNAERAAQCRAQLNALIDWNTNGRN